MKNNVSEWFFLTKSDLLLFLKYFSFAIFASVVLSGCGGGGDGGANNSASSQPPTKISGFYNGSVILPPGTTVRPEDLVVSSFSAEQQVSTQAHFSALQLIPNSQNTLFVKDGAGNVLLMGYYFLANVTIPASLRNFVVSQLGLTINAETTALALCMNNPVLADLQVAQLVTIADTIVKSTDFVVLVGQIEHALTTSTSSLTDITTHAALYIKATQITVKALNDMATTSAGVTSTTLSIRKASSTPSVVGTGSTSYHTPAPYVVDDYLDPSTGTHHHAFSNDVFVSYVADFSPTAGVYPTPPLLIDRQRTLNFHLCGKYPFLCADPVEKITPFDVDSSGNYTVTVWRGFSPDIWLSKSNGTFSASRCTGSAFADPPCIASQLTFLDFVSPILSLAGIDITGPEIVNGLMLNGNGFQLNESALTTFYNSIKEITQDPGNVIKGLKALTDVIKSNSYLIAGVLKNGGAAVSNTTLANGDVSQMASALSTHATIVKNFFSAIGSTFDSAKTTTKEVATLVPMASDFFKSPDKKIFYLANGVLVSQPVTPIISSLLRGQFHSNRWRSVLISI